MAAHQFADAAFTRIQGGISNTEISLDIRQQPLCAKLALGKEKDRKPIDPPPILQLKFSYAADPQQSYLQSPYYFIITRLVASTDSEAPLTPSKPPLIGTLVSSLHRLKDTDNSDGAFFVFADLSVNLEGSYRLRFELFEMQQLHAVFIKSVVSKPFVVQAAKNWQGLSESTFLTRSFSDQGVRLRLRKDPRSMLKKRGPASDNYEPRHYRNTRDAPAPERQENTGPVSQEMVRQQGQHEQSEYPEQAQLHAFEQRPQSSRRYSQASSSFSNPGPYEESSKRPRTGSEHSQAQSFGHQSQHGDSPQYPASRMYQEPQQMGYPSNAYAQQQTFGEWPTQSPTSSTGSLREQFFTGGRRLNTQSGSSSAGYEPNSQRSPQTQFFPHQSGRFQQSPLQQSQYSSQMMRPLVGPSPTQRSSALQTQSSFDGMDYRSPSVATGAAAMPPPFYAGQYVPVVTSASPRREIYPSSAYVQQPSLPTGTMSGTFPMRAPAATTTAPGSLDSPY